MVEYFLGVDGISLPLLCLTSLVSCVGVLASWRLIRNPRLYFFWYLLLNGCVMGAFMSLDFFLFFLFFECMLIPTYFLIGMWGGEKRETAALYFFFYTLTGSLMLLAVIIALYALAPVQRDAHFLHTLNIPLLATGGQIDMLLRGEHIAFFGTVQSAAWLLCLLLLTGFAIKLAVVPFHTWLPSAHVEAPTAISLLLSGVLLKVGGYGILRVGYGLFPHTLRDFSPWFSLLGVAGILYGGLNALSQHDLKKMIAYASLSHMGFVLVGFSSGTPTGFSGALFQMVSHGILSPALFLIAGGIEDRFGSRNINNYSGLAEKMPHFALLTALFFFAYLGTPGFSTFFAEIYIVMGTLSAYLQQNMGLWVVICLLLGIFLTAIYLVWSFQKVFYGTHWIREKTENGKVEDLTRRERFMLIPLAALSLCLGLLPQVLLGMIRPALLAWCPFLNS